jgi:sulfopyruvate decarboxylase subunit beta
MQRIDAVKTLAELVTPEDLFISSIGGLWDDWWNHRPGGIGTGNTFSPGILGSVSTTALGLAIALPHRRVVSLETDGSMLLNTGQMCTLGAERQPNLTVIVFDNGIYENIGGPPTHTARNTDLAKMADGAGCINCVTVHDVDSFRAEAERQLNDGESGFIVAKIEPGRHPWEWEDRKPTDGVEDKYAFMRYVERLEGFVVHPGAVQN